MLEKILESPWTARKSNQSILKEVNPEYSLEGRMLKLKLQYFGHLLRRANSLEKTLMLGKIEGRRRRGQQRMRRLDGIKSLTKLREMVKTRETFCAVVLGVAKSQTWLSNWKTMEPCVIFTVWCPSLGCSHDKSQHTCNYLNSYIFKI